MKLFSAKCHGKAGKPTFSAADAQQYFEKTYRDEERDHSYVPLPQLARPPIPAHIFTLRCPTVSKLRKSVHRKRNGAAPGMNALTYVPYKKCTAVMKFLMKLGHKVWKCRDIPADWAMAYIILLSKSEDLSQVSEFRPIAITCVAGKSFSRFCQIACKFSCSETATSPKKSKRAFWQECPGAWSILLHCSKLFVMPRTLTGKLLLLG